ncbi:MAG: site-specific tyrosine recombinase XerD [Anaerovoracaceae bacterium]|jgi:integrase/recombinase XerD|nr:site-specific tyrosine recombinase XerD [Anaerovoracaceae bacterium]
MHLDQFMDYLENERKKSRNTLEAYRRDIAGFFAFLEKRGAGDPDNVTNTEIVAFLMDLKNEGRAPATINRKMASVRAYYNYLLEKQYISSNPTHNVKTPKVEKKGIEYLSIEEVDRLLTMPDDSIRGKRDRAILELLYATGIRVNEVIAANVKDVNLRIGFFTCPGESGKARIIPIGRPARAALEEYIYNSRDMMVKDNKDEDALFVNYYGKRMTRQGLWKIMKEYADKAGLSQKLTPHILRNSFAVHMVQNGADLKSLQELLGHEDISATQIYLSVTKNRIKDVYDKTHPRA